MKLKLHIEELAVESFTTHAAKGTSGTVWAHANSINSCNTVDHFTCWNYLTCHGYGTCDGVYTCDRQCIPQEPQEPTDEFGSEPTPCCTQLRC